MKNFCCTILYTYTYIATVAKNPFHSSCTNVYITYVTGFAKRGLIHASDFATLMSHNFVCD